MRMLQGGAIAIASILLATHVYAQAPAAPAAPPPAAVTVYQIVDVPANKGATIQYVRAANPASVITVYTRDNVSQGWVQQAKVSTVMNAQPKATIATLPAKATGFQVRTDAVIDPGNGVLVPMGKATTTAGPTGTVFGYFQYAAHGDQHTEVDVNIQ